MHGILAIAPLLVINLLFAMSWRVSESLGHWPQDSGDFYAFRGDALYDIFNGIVNTILSYSCMGSLVLLVLTVVLSIKQEIIRPLVLFLVFVVGWLALLLILGRVFRWYLD